MPKWLVKAPDGKVIQFPDSFSAQDVNREMTKIYAPMLAPGVLPGAARPQLPQLGLTDQAASLAYRGANYGADVLHGGGQEVEAMATPIAKLFNKIPGVGETLSPREGINAMQAESVPQTTAEKIGRGATQMAEMYATGGPFRAGAEALMGRLGFDAFPFLGRFAAPAARIAAESVNTGANAAAHNQAVGPAALIGGIGGTAAEGLQAVAPKIAEGAIGITRRMRAGGRQIGQEILNSTSGITPGTVEDSANDFIENAYNELERRATAAGNQGARVTQKPAVDFLDQQIAKYQARNSPFAERLQELRDQLVKNRYTKAQIPFTQRPEELLRLKQGVGDTIKNWDIPVQRSVKPIEQHVYSLLDQELDRAIPGSEGLNQQMSNLIPARRQAGIMDDAASLPERVINRLRAHTGALTTAAAGGYEGYQYGHSPAAALGGAALGLVVPEMLANPTAVMGAARAMDSAAPLTLTRGIVAAQPQRVRDNPFLPY